MSEMVLSINNYDFLEDLGYQLKKQKKLIGYVYEDMVGGTDCTDEKAILGEFLEQSISSLDDCCSDLNSLLKCVHKGVDFDYKD